MAVSRGNLIDLQSRLNSDQKLKSEFLNDPVDTLRKEGIDLTPEMERNAAYLVDKLKRPGHLVPGAGIAPKDLAAITITIGVDF